MTSFTGYMTKRGMFVKTAIYLGEELACVVASEAKRLDRSRSWVIQRCIRDALSQVRELPSIKRLPIAQGCEQEG